MPKTQFSAQLPSVTWRTLVLAVVVSASLVGTVAAQTASSVRVVSRATPIVTSPRARSEVIMTAVQGTVLEVMDKEGGWYWVMLAPDMNGTRRPGWVAARDVEIVVAGETANLIRDLTQRVEMLQRQLDALQVPEPSTRQSTPAPDAGLARAQDQLDQARREYEQVVGSSEGAEQRPVVPLNASGVKPEKAWIDVNFGLARSAGNSYTAQLRDIRFSEPATFGVTYSFPRGAEFDFGGGYMFNRTVGVGLSFTGTAHRDAAALNIEIPHPTIFNASATDIAPTDAKLGRVEGAANFQAMFVAAQTDRVRVRVFGGPSYFRVKQDTVSVIRYEQAFLFFVPVNAVDITTFNTVESEATGWGFHAGGDVSFFFNRVVGVGGFARFSRGNVDLGDYGGMSEIKTGGFQSGGGLRLKF